MSSENGQKTAENRYPDELRDKIDRGETGDKVAASDPALAPLGADEEAGGHRPAAQETEMAIEEEAQSEPPGKSYYAEASLKKKITVFAVTTVLILIALGAIYTYWPLTAGAR
jgi:hypothetical protein